MTPRIPVSYGELIDRISILEIKVKRLRAPEQRANADRELAMLLETVAGMPEPPVGLAALKSALGKVNRRLWDIEDLIRQKEASQSFDAEFIELARAVYRTNDERSRIKREINALLRSDIVDEKQYTPYRQ
jgi:hypothetical protein